jgi:hypothetical protein
MDDERTTWDLASALHQKGLIALNMNKRQEGVKAFDRALPFLVMRYEGLRKEIPGGRLGSGNVVDVEKEKTLETWTRRMIESSVLVGEQANLKADLQSADQIFSRCLDAISSFQTDSITEEPLEPWLAPFIYPVTSGYTLTLDALGRTSQAKFWVQTLRTREMQDAVRRVEMRVLERSTIPIADLVSLAIESDRLFCHELSYAFFREAFSRSDIPPDVLLPPVVATAVQQALRVSLRDPENAEKHRKVAFEWMHAHVLNWPIRPDDPDETYRDVLEHWERETLLAWTRMEGGPLKLKTAEFEAWEALWRGLHRRYSIY